MKFFKIMKCCISLILVRNLGYLVNSIKWLPVEEAQTSSDSSFALEYYSDLECLNQLTVQYQTAVEEGSVACAEECWCWMVTPVD